MNKKGFTLIELMIGVAIIGIFAAIAIPKFARLVAKSSCDRGEDEGCRRYAELTGKAGRPEVAAPAPDVPASSSRQIIKGRVVKAEKSVAEGLPQYNGVVYLDNGTSMGFTVNDMVIEGTTICIEVSPDRTKADSLVLCK